MLRFSLSHSNQQWKNVSTFLFEIKKMPQIHFIFSIAVLRLAAAERNKIERKNNRKREKFLLLCNYNWLSFLLLSRVMIVIETGPLCLESILCSFSDANIFLRSEKMEFPVCSRDSVWRFFLLIVIISSWSSVINVVIGSWLRKCMFCDCIRHLNGFIKVLAGGMLDRWV